jgi:hypothetical protein
VRADAPGRFELSVTLGGKSVATRVLAAGGGLPRTAGSAETGWFHALLYPGERQLAGDGPVLQTRLRYPPRIVRYLGVELDWLVAFTLISMLGGLALKDALKVEV